MAQPLPAPATFNTGGLIDAYRVGHSDFLEAQKRELAKRAGGLAAAGNLKGAQAELYKGGDLAGAQNIAQEMRAGQSNARAVETHQLERALKGQELLSRLAGSIESPEQFEMAKARLKKLGLPVDNYTFDQLPQLRQQAVSVQEQIQNEITQRKLDILQQRADAKANAPAKLTEGQRKAASYLSIMKDAQDSAKAVLPGDDAESPMGTTSSVISRNMPPELAAKYRSKEQNQFWQAAEQWVIAKLRHQSGATINPDEILKEMRTYWPVPGDDIVTRRNKARARRRVEEAFNMEATGEVQQPANGQLQAPPGLPADPAQWSDEQINQFLNAQ